MKYLKTYEEKIELFKVGDLVYLTNNIKNIYRLQNMDDDFFEKYTNILYIIGEVKPWQYIEGKLADVNLKPAEYENRMNTWGWTSHENLRKATKKEMKKYKIEQTSKNYNL